MCSGDNQSDRLVGVENPVVLQRKIGLPVRMQVAPGPRRRVHAWHVAMREHRQHSGGLFGYRSIDGDRPAVRNRTLDDYAIDQVSYWNICRVACGAGHFEAPIDSGKWLSNGVHARAPAVSSARSATRCASSILNALCASGRASVNEAAIAVISASVSSRDTPRKADSAAVRRQGLCATPPKAIRAEPIRLRSATTAAAVETSANSYDWRSRSFSQM